MLSDYEKDQIISVVLRCNNKRMKIVAAICSASTESAIKYAKKYSNSGVDYLLVTSPPYVKPNDEGLFNHYKLIAESVKIPIILYNIPNRTGVNLNYNIIKKLKDIPNIVGIKESNKDINHIMEVFKLCDENFSVYCGNDDLIYLFLHFGAIGLINVYGNVEPKVIKSVISLFESNIVLFKVFFYRYYEMFKMIFIETNPIPIKSLMNYKGFGVGTHRLPLSTISKDNYEKLINMYNSII